MPPTSIVIASFWLASGILLGLARFTAEFLNSSQNPMQIGWFVWIALLGLTNIVSVVFFFFQKPRAQIYYYGSLILLFFSGTIFFVVFARSGQQAGAFAAQCLTGALIFTISFLPYRDRFAKSNSIDPMQQIAIPAGLLACLLLIPLRGQEPCQKQVAIPDRGRWGNI